VVILVRLPCLQLWSPSASQTRSKRFP